MASPQDLASFNRLRTGVDVNTQLIPKPPPLPKEVLMRFPSLIEWQDHLHDYLQKQLAITVRGPGQ